MTAIRPAGTQARLAEQRSEIIWQNISGRRGTVTDWTLIVLVWVSAVLAIWLVLWSPERHWHGGAGTLGEMRGARPAQRRQANDARRLLDGGAHVLRPVADDHVVRQLDAELQQPVG